MDYLTRQQTYNAALIATNESIRSMYDEAIAATDDHIANVMGIEAVWLHLNGASIPETDPDMLVFAAEGNYKVFNVTISTQEKVPVFVPNDGTTVYSEW